MFGFLQKIFGTKSEKDIKAIQPVVDQINAVYKTLNTLSGDQLRERSLALRKKIQEYIAPETEKINGIKANINSNPEMGVEEKESLYKQIDEIEKDSLKKIEEVLLEILPEAFSLIKETARRWKENGEIKVTASDVDVNYLKRHNGAQNVVIEN